MKTRLKTARMVFVAGLLTALPVSGQAQTSTEADPAASEEQIKLASALFKSAVEDMKDEHYAEAHRKLVESRRLNAKPGTLFTLAECEVFLDQVLSAKTHYEEFLSMVNTLPQTQQKKYADRAQDAAQKLAELEQAIPKLRFIIPPQWNPNTIVRVDGIVFSHRALLETHPMNPGAHSVFTQLNGGPVHEEHHTLKKGEEWTVRLHESKAPLTPPPPVPTKAVVPALNTKERGFFDIVPASAFVLGSIGILGSAAGIAVLSGDHYDKKTQHAAGGVALALGLGCLLGGSLIVIVEAASNPPAQAWIRPEFYASPQGASFGLRGAF